MEKNLTTTTPEEEEEVELVVDPKQLEKNKEVRSTVPRYRWANVYDTCDGNMTLLTNDVSSWGEGAEVPCFLRVRRGLT